MIESRATSTAIYHYYDNGTLAFLKLTLGFAHETVLQLLYTVGKKYRLDNLPCAYSSFRRSMSDDKIQNND